MLAKPWLRVLGGRQTLHKRGAGALLPELFGDVAACVNKDVSDITARVLVTSDDEVPGITRIRRSIRIGKCFAVAMGITEDDERRPRREGVYESEVRTWSATSVRTGGRDIAPDGARPIMSGHSFVNLLSLLNEGTDFLRLTSL